MRTVSDGQSATTLGKTVNWQDKADQISLLFNVVMRGTVCFPGQTRAQRRDTGSAMGFLEGVTSWWVCAVKLPCSRTFNHWTSHFWLFLLLQKNSRENIRDKFSVKFYFLIQTLDFMGIFKGTFMVCMVVHYITDYEVSVWIPTERL